MAMSLAESVSSSLFFIFFITFGSRTRKVMATNAMKPLRTSTKLIHHDSIFFQPYRAEDDYITRFTESSIVRFAYLRATIERELGNDNTEVNIKGEMRKYMFFVNFSIGEPPVPQLALMDTGSSLLWTQCLPCEKCSRQVSPMLNPSASSTYFNLSCTDSICREAPNGDCGAQNQCSYKQTYIKGAESKGVLATEQLTFRTSENYVAVTPPNIVFACGHENQNLPDLHVTGVLGLGAKPTSLAVQLGSKFSYCIGDIGNPEYEYNRLVLGQNTELEGKYTPLETYHGFYHITLEEIRVGEKLLDISPYIFQRRGPRTGVLIDTGTVVTWLAEDAYKVLHSEIKNILDSRLKRYWYENYLCYIGKVIDDLADFPVVTLRFAEGAEMVLQTASIFAQAMDDVLCMAVRSSTEHGKDYKDLSAIGLMAQQYYNIAYDLEGLKVYFQNIDCELLDD